MESERRSSGLIALRAGYANLLILMWYTQKEDGGQCFHNLLWKTEFVYSHLCRAAATEMLPPPPQAC